MFNTVAKQMFRTLLVECNEQHGWQIPDALVNYEAEVLASKIDRCPWQPEPSYAERYLKIRTVTEAWELANTCWFTRAVFPELKQRHGIKERYYVDMGQGCLSKILEHTDLVTVRQIHRHFEFLAETAYTAIRLNQEFRMMWD